MTVSRKQGDRRHFEDLVKLHNVYLGISTLRTWIYNGISSVAALCLQDSS